MKIDKKYLEERVKALGSDINIVQGQIQEIDKKRLDTVAQLNALHGAKQQCESMLKELHDDDQTAADVVAGS
jgi:ABC-type methionine transport system ATPase subunit|tara:strand:+ start:287 stop:502 length:216 start_codon:yes stop_codon:yes gene_type:complete